MNVLLPIKFSRIILMLKKLQELLLIMLWVNVSIKKSRIEKQLIPLLRINLMISLMV
nr:MAG: hypothetical protein [Bacteriophage sp.]